MGWLLQLLKRKPRARYTLMAKVIRADGTVEDLGVISRTESKGWGVTSGGRTDEQR